MREVELQDKFWKLYQEQELGRAKVSEGRGQEMEGGAGRRRGREDTRGRVVE